jgi:hypothetical protein
VSEPRIPKTFRLPRSLVDELDTVAVLAGRSRTSVVEEALRARLSRPEPQGAPESEETVDLAQWLSIRRSEPVSLLRHFIGQGRVAVGGVVCHDLQVSRSRLDQVSVDGERVVR